MKLKHFVLVGALMLLAGALVSCVLPNTATLHIKNTTGFAVTAASFTPSGGTATDRLRGDTIPNDEGHYFYSITPNTYDISLTLQGYAGGSYLAFDNLVLEKNHLVFRTTPTPP